MYLQTINIVKNALLLYVADSNASFQKNDRKKTQIVESSSLNRKWLSKRVSLRSPTMMYIQNSYDLIVL